MFGSVTPFWKVETRENVTVTSGGNFALSGPIDYLYFLISNISNTLHHFFRIQLSNASALGHTIALNFCTKSPSSVLTTGYDSQILCYGGDPTSGQNGKGTMVLNADKVGINRTTPTYTLDVNGTINCGDLKSTSITNTGDIQVGIGNKVITDNIHAATEGELGNISFFKRGTGYNTSKANINCYDIDCNHIKGGNYTSKYDFLKIALKQSYIFDAGNTNNRSPIPSIVTFLSYDSDYYNQEYYSTLRCNNTECLYISGYGEANTFEIRAGNSSVAGNVGEVQIMNFAGTAKGKLSAGGITGTSLALGTTGAISSCGKITASDEIQSKSLVIKTGSSVSPAGITDLGAITGISLALGTTGNISSCGKITASDEITSKSLVIKSATQTISPAGISNAGVITGSQLKIISPDDGVSMKGGINPFGVIEGTNVISNNLDVIKFIVNPTTQAITTEVKAKITTDGHITGTKLDLGVLGSIRAHDIVSHGGLEIKKDVTVNSVTTTTVEALINNNGQIDCRSLFIKENGTLTTKAEILNTGKIIGTELDLGTTGTISKVGAITSSDRFYVGPATTNAGPPVTNQYLDGVNILNAKPLYIYSGADATGFYSAISSSSTGNLEITPPPTKEVKIGNVGGKVNLNVTNGLTSSTMFGFSGQSLNPLNNPLSSSGFGIGNGDGASYTICNMAIYSHHGIGFCHTIAHLPYFGQSTIFMDLRGGSLSCRGNISCGTVSATTINADGVNIPNGNKLNFYSGLDKTGFYSTIANHITTGNLEMYITSGKQLIVNGLGVNGVADVNVTNGRLICGGVNSGLLVDGNGAGIITNGNGYNFYVGRKYSSIPTSTTVNAGVEIGYNVLGTRLGTNTRRTTFLNYSINVPGGYDFMITNQTTAPTLIASITPSLATFPSVKANSFERENTTVVLSTSAIGYNYGVTDSTNNAKASGGNMSSSTWTFPTAGVYIVTGYLKLEVTGGGDGSIGQIELGLADVVTFPVTGLRQPVKQNYYAAYSGPGNNTWQGFNVQYQNIVYITTDDLLTSFYMVGIVTGNNWFSKEMSYRYLKIA